jgi:lipopolysaccharide exporter
MRSQLARGVVWLSAAKVAVNVLAAISTVLLARFLSPEDFGLAAIGMTLLTIIATVTELSLGQALVQKDEVHELHYHTAWTLNLIRTALMGLALVASAPVVAHVYADGRLVPIMVCLGLSISLCGLSSPKTVIYTRNLVFWQEFAQVVVQKLAGFVVCIGVAYVYHSYWALVAGTVAAQLAGVVVTYVVAPYRPQFSLAKWRELLSFSVWLTLGQLLTVLNGKLDQLLVGARLGKTTLGYYSVGDNLAGMPTSELVGPIERTLFPGFVAIVGNKPRLRKAYRAAQSLVCALALPAGVGCACIAQPLILLAMGERWLPTVHIIEVVAVAVALQTISSAAHPLGMAMGATKMLFKRDLVGFCIRVPIIVVGLYADGLNGLLWARGASAVLVVAMNMYIVHTLIGLGVWKQLRANLRAFVSAGVMALGLLALKGLLMQEPLAHHLVLVLALMVLVGALIYGATSALLWWLAGKPPGPEVEILRMADKLLVRMRARAAAVG